MPELKIINIPPPVVAIARGAGVCRRCSKDCCNCDACIARKGDQIDVCNRCYQKEQNANRGGN